MSRIFSVQDRQDAFDYVLSVAGECSRIVALVQVGSGAVGFRDERSDLDFVIALDSDGSMAEVMEYMHRKICGKYELVFSARDESRHLQNFVLSNLLELDFGYGGYEHAAARKPAFRVLFDRSGVVEEKMIRSREWMNDRIYGEKQKKDAEAACGSVWIRLMHAAVAIRRGNGFRAMGELDYVRRLYVDLLGDLCRFPGAQPGRNGQAAGGGKGGGQEHFCHRGKPGGVMDSPAEPDRAGLPGAGRIQRARHAGNAA